MAADYEPDRRGAAIEFRKHLGWYVKGLPRSAELRQRLHQVTSLDEVESIFGEYLVLRASGNLDEAEDRSATLADEGVESQSAVA
jgi:hypothetical protein